MELLEKLFGFYFKYKRRKSDFPLSQFSRIVVDRPKHNIGSKEFKKLVNENFKPMLKKNGFEGNDYFYYRLRSNNIETILLGTSPYGKAICINLEIKKANGVIPKVSEIEQLESISPKAMGWKRLSPDNKDCWWWFRPTEKENLEVFKEMYDLLSIEGEKYFLKYNK